jgi:hypothetical protein
MLERVAPAAAVLIFLLSLSSAALAQYPNIRVSNPASTDPEEVAIAINPADPLNLAAGANLDYYYYSFDGGWTWSEGQLSTSLGVWGDPVVAFDTNGSLYYSHLSNPDNGEWLDRIVVQKSTDGGVTWDDGAGVGLNPPKEQDKEWMSADLTDSPWRDNLYLCWTQFDDIFGPGPEDSTRILFSRSTDAGASWSDALRIGEMGGNCLDDDDTVEGAVPAVGPNGEIYTSWSGHDVIRFDKSTDGGISFRQDVVVASQPGGWNFDIPGIFRCNGFPVTACDISDSPYRGNVYILWSDQRNGINDTDVFFIRSTDGGATWGGMVRVNDDVGVAHQFFPWMTVDPFTGNIHVVFYDRRATIGNATEVWVARSVDGGDTFVNFRVSETPFTPVSHVFFGDYINIAARDGIVYPIWMRMDGTNLSIWAAIIQESTGITVSTAGVTEFNLLNGIPNPWSPGQPLEFELPWDTAVTLSVYDARGRLMRTLVDGQRSAGRHSVTWSPGDLPAGVYFVGMKADRYRASTKLVVVE